MILLYVLAWLELVHISFFILILFCFNMFKTLWHLWKKIGMHETLAIKKYGFRAFSPIIKASHKPRTFTFHSVVWLHDSSPVVSIALTEVFSSVHVLLVSLFGQPIVRSISHFFGLPFFFGTVESRFKKDFGSGQNLS